MTNSEGLTRRELLKDCALMFFDKEKAKYENRTIYARTLASTPLIDKGSKIRARIPKDALLRVASDQDQPDYYLVIPDTYDYHPRSPFYAKNALVPKSYLSVLDPKVLTPDTSIRPIANPWVDISLKVPQELTVYHGECPVYQSPICAGARVGDTPVGTFRVSRARLSRHMRGSDYDLPGVGFVQYFHHLGIALHSAYWRSNEQFGHPYSHGCINLPYQAALWLFANLVPHAREYYSHEEKFPSGVKIKIHY